MTAIDKLPDFLYDRGDMSYKFSRVDVNQKEIVAAFRKLGYIVQHTHQQGSGFPDIIICSQTGYMELIEIKDGSKPPSGQKLTEPEVRFHNNWPRKIPIINSVEAVLKLHESIKNDTRTA